MQDNDFQVFTVLMATIGELYGKIISKPLAEIYWRTLKNFEWQDVQQALEAHIHHPDSGQFFPKPADLIRFIEGSGETKALLAWAKVDRAIIEVGIYQSVVFDDPLIHAVLEDMGGWVKICSTKGKQLPLVFKEFQKRYRDFVKNKPTRYPKHLYGIAECENLYKGFAVDPPVFVGDRKKAERLLNEGGTPLTVQGLRTIENVLLKYTSTTGGKDHDHDQTQSSI